MGANYLYCIGIVDIIELYAKQKEKKKQKKANKQTNKQKLTQKWEYESIMDAIPKL